MFEKYPTWEALEQAAIFSSLLLEQYFGSVDNENWTGIAHYAQCVKYGIGREVLAKMLEGTETDDRANPFSPRVQGCHGTYPEIRTGGVFESEKAFDTTKGTLPSGTTRLPLSMVRSWRWCGSWQDNY